MPTTAITTIMDTDPLARLRLLQLTSPALPIGAFTYSQGLEWAVDAGWVKDSETLDDWLRGLIDDALAQFELPILTRLYHACAAADVGALDAWGKCLYAGRESRELRAEERNRARALNSLLRDLGIDRAGEWQSALGRCQAAGFAFAAAIWFSSHPQA